MVLTDIAIDMYCISQFTVLRVMQKVGATNANHTE